MKGLETYSAGFTYSNENKRVGSKLLNILGQAGELQTPVGAKIGVSPTVYLYGEAALAPVDSAPAVRRVHVVYNV